jgi:hypothetical protein
LASSVATRSAGLQAARRAPVGRGALLAGRVLLTAAVCVPYVLAVYIACTLIIRAAGDWWRGLISLVIELGPFGGAQAGGPNLPLWAIAYFAVVFAATFVAFAHKDL